MTKNGLANNARKRSERSGFVCVDGLCCDNACSLRLVCNGLVFDLRLATLVRLARHNGGMKMQNDSKRRDSANDYRAANDDCAAYWDAMARGEILLLDVDANEVDAECALLIREYTALREIGLQEECEQAALERIYMRG